jgi:hypothetical protein
MTGTISNCDGEPTWTPRTRGGARNDERKGMTFRAKGKGYESQCNGNLFQFDIHCVHMQLYIQRERG